MDGKKILEVISTYRNKLQSLNAPKIDYPHGRIILPDDDRRLYVLAHCHGMLDQMEEFVRDNRIDKAFRWLGFIQGAFWSEGLYNLEELKNHNRP